MGFVFEVSFDENGVTVHKNVYQEAVENYKKNLIELEKCRKVMNNTVLFIKNDDNERV